MARSHPYYRLRGQEWGQSTVWLREILKPVLSILWLKYSFLKFAHQFLIGPTTLMVRLFKKSKLEILPEDTEKFSVKITFLTKTKGGRSFSSVTSPFSSWVPFNTCVELKLSISDGDFGGWFISDFFPKKLLHLWLQIFDYAICSEDTLEMLDTTTKRASLVQPLSVLCQLPLYKKCARRLL